VIAVEFDMSPQEKPVSGLALPHEIGRAIMESLLRSGSDGTRTRDLRRELSAKIVPTIVNPVPRRPCDPRASSYSSKFA
jgi:hypothetical protein